MGDPYSRMAAILRSEAAEVTPTGETSMAGLGARPAKMRLGTVTQREPLKIRVMGIEQPTEALRINERLTRGAKWKTKVTSAKGSYDGLSGKLSGDVSCSGGQGSPQLGEVSGGKLRSTNTVIDEAEMEQLEVDLEVDDQVLLLTEDDQIFYILMKVVKAV